MCACTKRIFTSPPTFKGQASLVRLGSTGMRCMSMMLSVSVFTCTMPMGCSCTVEPRLVDAPGKSTPQQCAPLLTSSRLIRPILLMKTSPYNADTAAICFLISKEVHITGAPLHVTLNVECAGYSWRCTEQSETVYRSLSVFSSRIHKLQYMHFLYALVPCPMYLCLLECTHNN